jgi:hypothetical protein
MPGAPHMRAGQPIEKRSVFMIVCLFFVLPVLAGGGMLCHLGWYIISEGGQFTTSDWFGMAWNGLIGFGVTTSLPAAGYQELRRRRQLRDASAGQLHPGSGSTASSVMSERQD